ncbi:MAG: hypothetical protein HQK79_11305 [Desulfobacterales bacterium]|nr:hypothetical protein [Desulfobacterales bacterium]
MLVASLVDNQLATKQDLKELELNLKRDLEVKIEISKSETIKWVAGMLVAQAALIATLVKLL